ncbi:Cadmium, zinc and cobalt-transporting ATPase [Fervidicola ferrireducens]|uniref:Cd(2+)-exporting ATPase n=1 Tax=Fervidicola ferrireducens TaxID=520764 RepID=A0A140L2S2_9FIRM|nr:heavy metal translocating P-type ATPase [Fervidicola ferrireducens]KXG74847.1 Cadmium, zinc and cobalt-transporting ATPase [Fervidicola ferrireducens]
MSKETTMELILEGLECANCAMKIEAKVNELKGVKQASLNFATKVLSIEVDNTIDANDIFSLVNKIVKDIEPDVIVKEKNITRSTEKTLILMGLDCVNCAGKIEAETRKIAGVKSASLDFISKKLRLEVENKHELDRIISHIKRLVKEIEPEVEVVDEEEHDIKCACEDDRSNAASNIEANNKKWAVRLGISAAFFAAALLIEFPYWVEFSLFLISYILSGGEVVLRAVKNITKGQVFDENFLLTIATIGAFIIQEFPEGVAVMLFFQVGMFLQNIAVNRSRKSIAALLDIRPDFANLKVGDEIKKVSPKDVKVGDIIVVKPGEKIPLDGKIIDGRSMVDTSALTGESVPREVEVGNDVLAGFININGLLTIEVSKEFGESTVSKILDLVQNASSRKAPTENFITKFARRYTPVVTMAAALIAIVPPLIVPGATFTDWLYRALVFLVISCPCALVVSIPLGFFGGIGGASKNGVLVKGSNYLEALNDVDTVVFDKTGTLTKGVFKVTQINPQGNVSKDELLEYAAFAESFSNHPIALSILKAYGKEVDKNEIENYEEISGHGIKAKVKGKTVLVGNAKLMARENIAYVNTDAVGTTVHVAIDGVYAGFIVISDEVKEDSANAVKGLKSIGVRRLVMLTGDSKAVAEKIGKQLGLDEVYAELLPDQKVEKLEMLEKQKSPKGKLVFVGDGINDAPVLARADVGVAMGGLGSDAAIEAADVVLMTDEPSKLVTAIKIAKRTRRIVWQNIIFSLGVKIIVLALGAGGIATMWEAVFADVGVALIAIVNAMRAMKVDRI